MIGTSKHYLSIKKSKYVLHFQENDARLDSKKNTENIGIARVDVSTKYRREEFLDVLTM